MSGENHDWFNALARYELKVDKDGAASASMSSKQAAHVASIEANMAVAPRATLFVKYAGRLLDDRAVGLSRSSLTQMAQGRLTFDVTPRIDLGVDGRFLWQDQRRSLTQSWGVEAGYRLATNFWLSLGYNFTAYDQGAFAPDAELASQGPYLSFRYKFDEGLGRFLRGGPLTLKGEKPTQAVTEPIPDTEKIPVHCCPN